MRILLLSLDLEMERRNIAMKALAAWLVFSILSIAVAKAQCLTVVKSVTSANCGTCNGKADVTVSGGTAPYTYAWSTGENKNKATSLCPGSYTCTITDKVGCSVTETLVINSVGGASASATVTDVSCYNGSNGSITLTGVTGGTAPYTYAWSPTGGTGITASGLVAGTYTCTITDINGCVGLTVATVNQPAAITPTVSQTNVSCFGATDGSASVSVTGGVTPYTYSWSPSGGTASTALNLGAGNYVVTVKDIKGCSTPTNVTITQPAQLTATISKTDIVCNNQTNGTATVNVTGGTTPYSYAWSNGKTTAAITALTANSYNCTITDAKGCSVTKSTSIINPPTWTASVTSTNATCKGGSNGSATVITSGETAPYTYQWTSGKGTNVTATGLTAGTYSCTVTDKNGCAKVVTATISEPAVALVTSGNSNPASCHDGNNGEAWVSVSGGGGGPYTYSWSTGETTSLISDLIAGTYICTITDNVGCAKAQSVNVSEPSAVTVSFTKKDLTCNGDADGEATAIGAGGIGPYNYYWTTNPSVEATATNLDEGFQEVLVLDANMCDATGTVELKRIPSFTATLSHTDATCGNAADGTASVTITGGVPPFNYEWSPTGGSGPIATNLAPGIYVISIQDDNGCAYSDLVQVKGPTAIKANAVVTKESCLGTSDGVIALSPTGGTAPYTYSWTQTGGTSIKQTGLAQGTYDYQITDSKSCFLKASSVVGKEVCTSTNKPSEEIEVAIYPNPAKDYIQIEAPYKVNTVRLMDMSGREIITTMIDTQLMLPEMEKGLYFVEITTDKGKVVKKIMVD